MQNILKTVTTLDEQQLITPTSTQQFELGTEIIVSEKPNSSSEIASKAVKKFIYVKAHASLTAYQPYILTYSGTAGSEKVTAAPATLAAPGSLVVVPQITIASGYYGFVQVEGDCKVLMTAETYAVGDFLQILNAGTALVVDGTTGSTVLLVNSSAICKEAGATAVARKAYLLGTKAVVAAT